MIETAGHKRLSLVRLVALAKKLAGFGGAGDSSNAGQIGYIS
jgi:hypothetical protein